MNKCAFFALAGLVALAACGQQKDLHPREGAGMPPKPATARITA